MSGPFKMKGSALYGKGNQSPLSQIGGAAHTTTPPPGWRAERQAPAAPAAPSAASLDYVNPTENSSPASQRPAKPSTQAGINKAEQYAVRDAQGGPVEGGPLEPTPYTPPNPGSTGTSSGGPGGGPGPMAQVAPKTKVSDVDAMTRNKMESYAARSGGPTESGPIEQKGSPTKQGKEGMSANELVAIRKNLKAKKEKLAKRKSEGKITLMGNRKRRKNSEKIKKNQELINKNPEAIKWKNDARPKPPQGGKRMMMKEFKKLIRR